MHGGPTSFSTQSMNLRYQYFTSRGFAVCDVNYRGSTGYGRPFRHALNYNWGVYDVEDAVNAARYLANEKKVDINRLCISGGSAGGYTTLAALVSSDVFKAGCSRYGICDLTALAHDTHKFEARYLDTLIGPYPQAESTYKERSPINHIDKFSCPLMIFQGDEDKVVPLNQAQLIFDALKNKGIPVGMEIFEGEGHGFRKAENIKRSVDGELGFYCKVFGINADHIPSVTLENETSQKK